MHKNVDIKNRTVEYFSVDTGSYENEIFNLLKRNMKVIFYSATFNNRKYVFTGSPSGMIANSITVTGFRAKAPGENLSVEIV